ncbi:linker histone H1 and H5 family protein [Necator americanus]|uniref:Linker histone H1 and H5 family protein n=1 Tax=Necator americanus TaxID=51031 RepID=W2TF07_NECAM|nr:linker histone H1 and H5 family protein [Necator americanus]ETN80408.1 linker histone H1 and H5 family protein [Necator americanus]
MSDAVVAPPTPTAPATATSTKKVKPSKPKGEKKAKVAPSHPVYGAMIKAAIKELKDRKGASKQAIFKFIIQKYKVGDNEKQINARLRLALKKGVEKGLLKQASGTGAAGRFRLAESSEIPAKPKVAKIPKAATDEAKPKKATATKPKAPKATKEKSAKSPKKATKPKAKTAKSPKKAATPKKAAPKPKATKKTAPKKAAPAKS